VKRPKTLRKLLASFGLLAALAGCVEIPTTTQPKVTKTGPSNAEARAAAQDFATVVTRVEPVAERICRERAPELNCDFRIVVDDSPRAPPNAFQTVDRNKRPIIAFTVSLIITAQNQDELAFIMAHEAAHHIEGHLQRQQRNAQLGAEIFGALVGGTNARTQRTAQQLGASIGARTYSKDFELEADALGTRIAFAAGYNPVNGAEFFQRIPDPGKA